MNTDYLQLIEPDNDFDKRVVLEAERFYDTHPEIQRAATVLGVTRAEYIHRYALIQWAQRPRITTSSGSTKDWVWVKG